MSSSTIPAVIDDVEPTGVDEVALLDADGACRLLGGNRPINRASLYRGMARGIYPRPIKIGSHSRWLKTELVDAILARRRARDGAAA